jgi:2-polyprenyl-3-methyl-5-hydroxy-6-metoxy-1,4-benzoquinol methylase
MREQVTTAARRASIPLERRAYEAYIYFDPVRHLEIGSAFARVAIQPGERVLDLGCGRGYWAGKAARAGADVVAYDVKRERVARAAIRYPRVRFVHGSAEETGLEDESFDVVLILSVLEHTAEPERVLAEIARVLRPGGRLALTTDTFDDERWRPSRERHAARWDVRRFFGRAEIQKLLESNGLAVTWSKAHFGFRFAPQLLRARMAGNQLHWLFAPAVWVAALAAGDTGQGALLSLTAVKTPRDR